MSKVVFSSWAGKIIDNRGLHPDRQASSDLVGFPLKHDGRRIRAFMSWNGLVVADDKINIVDMAYSYLKEVQKLSCGKCSVGYLGTKSMLDTVAKFLSGEGTEKDIDLLQWLGSVISKNTRCDFCALAVSPVQDTIKYYRGEYARLIGSRGAVPTSVYLSKVTAPCMEACPAHQDIPGYIELTEDRRYLPALELIRETNCFPGVIGRACVAFCEANCVRNDIDSPLAIRPLKRVPADYEMANGLKPRFKKKVGEGNVAIVGAGPAGLAASYNLALMGYKVTVYDEQSSAGGMAFVGIPPYRLPKDILEREVDILKRLGIKLKLNTRVGKDVTLEQLFSQGFKAVFIATGAHLNRASDIGGWSGEVEGLVDGVEFLHNVNAGKKVAPKNKVIIVGGGNVAVDCARTCLRLGFNEVAIVYRRSKAEMPGRREEVEAAEQEGVRIQFLAVPVRVLTEGGRVVGAECTRMELGEPDASGRRRPVPVKGSEFVMPADMIISAIGEMPDLSILVKGINRTDAGTIKVDLPSHRTGRDGVFSGGDCVTGPATLIEAVAAGNRAARSIDQYLRTGKVTTSEQDVLEDGLHDIALSRRRDGAIVARRPRQSPGELAIPERKRSFNEVEHCFTAEAAQREAARCLRCYRVMLLSVANKTGI